jgi:hypothetical protein
MADEITTEDIVEAATSAQSMNVDGLTVQAVPVPDLIEADRYARAKDASQRKLGGIRLGRFIPPGAAPR